VSNRETLDSWKEIAGYLGRSVKTCRRWEHELGLPVHRLEESPKARVFAYPAELDQWVKTTQKSDEIQVKKQRLSRNKSLLYVFSAVLIAIVIISGILLLTRQEASFDSIAILPIVNDSGDPDQEYFANSLTTLLISELYKLSSLRVVPREAIMAYKNSAKSLKEKAKELNVKALLEASVLKSGDKIRLTASLIDPYRNRIIWSDTLEREYSEILILQSELSQAIVNGIRISITPDEKIRVFADQKVNPEAYDLVMHGIDVYWGLFSSPSVSTLKSSLDALDYFHRAIDIDPSLALAYAWVAHAYWTLGLFGEMDEKEAYPKAKAAALKALELDDNQSQAHSTLGLLKLYMDWDFVGAEYECRKAADLGPGDWLTKTILEEILIQSGKVNEGIALLEQRMEELEKAESRKIYSHRSTVLYLMAGCFDDALEEQKNYIIRLSDPSWPEILFLAISYAVNGKYSEAIAQIEKIKDLSGSQYDLSLCAELAWILAVSGRREEALNELEKIQSLMAQRNVNSAYNAARVYANLGDNDKAFEYLYQAYESHSTFMVNLVSDWALHGLHGDSRFDDLVKRVGFPDTATSGKK
jgi:TolB-like protein